MKFIQKSWKNDPRSKNFSHSRFFGSITSFPSSLNRPRIIPLNQGETLRCAAYAAAANGQYINGVSMSPDWQVDKISRLQGTPVDAGGSDPNAAMNSQLYPRGGGYLPIEDWNGNGMALDSEAANFGDSAYIKVTGPDYFTGVKTMLIHAYNQNNQRGACGQAFSPWYTEWMGPYITTAKTILGGHSYLFIDWCTENGVEYLIVQNSYGLNIGDQGFQKMSKEVVNDIFSRGGSTIKFPMTLTTAQRELATQQTPWGKIQLQILLIWAKLTSLYGSSY